MEMYDDIKHYYESFSDGYSDFKSTQTKFNSKLDKNVIFEDIFAKTTTKNDFITMFMGMNIFKNIKFDVCSVSKIDTNSYLGNSVVKYNFLVELHCIHTYTLSEEGKLKKLKEVWDIKLPNILNNLNRIMLLQLGKYYSWVVPPLHK